ncbi:MAG: restriction endonuclease subunit S [Deltaproteobacteria bacterium]|nr:restriction endonuclease subunit S [Deltaproteobacteria bacterium]
MSQTAQTSLFPEKQPSAQGLWPLPSGWEWMPLGTVCQINPRRPRLERTDDTPTSFLPMSGVDEVDGTITGLEERPFREVMRGFTYFEEGDVLFAKITPCMQNGKCAVARGLRDPIGFGSTEFHVLRPGSHLTADWVHRFLRRLAFRLEAKEHFRGAVGQQRVPEDFLTSSVIPVPPNLDIQYRIVGRSETLLAEVKEARTLAASIRRDTDRIMEAALAETVSEFDRCFRLLSVGQLAEAGRIRLAGGGTPSKANAAYWTGPVPWVSPKDMKRWLIDDAEDHISIEALKETSARRVARRAVLVVVRGMILAHTWPVAVTTVDVAINQDMKALCPDESLKPKYLGYVLRARAREVLPLVETAAHGTRRLKSETLESVTIPDAPLPMQEQLVTYLGSVQAEVSEMRRLQAQDAELLDQLEQSILERAFRGEL